MCWISYKPPVKRVAETDILVYKVVNYKPHTDECCSLIFNFLYKFGVIYDTDIKIKYSGNGKDTHVWMGNEGFHSFSNEKAAVYESDIYVEAYYSTIVKCVIPKGSDYYINEYDEVISNNIVILSKESPLQRILNYLDKWKFRILKWHITRRL